LDKYCTLLFLKDGDQILLAMKKRGFGVGYWNGVGGKIEPGETLEQALIRECQEEIGVTPTTWHKVAEHDFLMDTDSSPRHMFVHAFITTEWEGEPLESDEMAPKWFAKTDIPFSSMWQDDPHWIPHVLEGKKIVGAFTFDQANNLLTHDVTHVETLPGDIPTAANM
jgi:mutator protein MutT